MSKKENAYWKARVQAEMAQKQAQDVQIGEEMARLHAYHMQQIEKEIESFYQKYANKNKITLAEARKRASQMDVEAFQDKARRYVEEKNFSPQANAELALYNLKMKVSRLELLQYHIDLEMVALSNGEHQLTEKFLNQEFVREMNTQAGILGKVVASPKGIGESAQAIINTPFHGATWSDKIWQRQQLLRGIVAQATQNTIIKGKSPLDLIPMLRREFGVSASHAKRLAVTETARVQTAVQKASYEANDIERYIFMAEPSACPICASLDDKSFLVSEMEPGKNACPMHPHCHCSTSPDASAEREALEKMLKESEKTEEDDTIKVAGVEKGKAMTFEEADGNKSNPNYRSAREYQINCQTCVVAYEARLRGYDVEAKGNTPGSLSEKLARRTYLAWIDPVTGDHPLYITDSDKVYTARTFKRFLEEQVEANARYTLEFAWTGRGDSGHIVSAERLEDGQIRIYDPQTGEIITGKGIDKLLKEVKYSKKISGFNMPMTPKLLRVDGLDFNADFTDNILKRREE